MKFLKLLGFLALLPVLCLIGGTLNKESGRSPSTKCSHEHPKWVSGHIVCGDCGAIAPTN